MTVITENVIPGNHGRIFTTNASSEAEMEELKSIVEKIDGVKDVVLIKEVYPKEFIVHTTKLIKNNVIEKAVNELKIKAIPKGIFPLLNI
ncbi:heavy-metal-associated domain-containing protein [Bizionia gelidisalsuginis]|uniref:Heavy-metal-associated domain-containing protein n=1 Tax=Bizionia gelidisalsuginis TaxID=291188 RepID=A0ABY3MCY8_9FLAO|nr:heavy-metal-associated domain-containing protein [Bizionia gelidisalsuginis]TYC16184.1 heavy-metal-associated domain-containing protein [Bizionia gelidisalsuginis]